MRRLYWNLISFAVLLILLLSILTRWTGVEGPSEVSYASFREKLEQGLITEVSVQGDRILGKTSDGRTLLTRGAREPEPEPRPAAWTGSWPAVLLPAWRHYTSP